MTTSAVSTLIYQTAGTMQAAAAGFILLSMITVRSLLQYVYTTDRSRLFGYSILDQHLKHHIDNLSMDSPWAKNAAITHHTTTSIHIVQKHQ